MLRGSSQIRLSQLDVAPLVQAAQMTEAANVNLNNAINQSILNFTKKQEQKKQEKIGISSIQNMLGIDDPNLAKSIYKDEIVRDAYTMQQEARYELAAQKASAKEIEASQLRALYPNMPEAVVQDIVYDRLLQEKTEGGETTGLFQSKSSGQIFDLRDFMTPSEPRPEPEPEPKPEPDADGFEAPTLGNQGLYGRLILLDKRGDAPTGVEQAVVSGIDTLFSSVFGDSPVNLDPDIRSFQNDLENNLNIFANSLKVGTRYSSTEQRDMVQAMEDMSSGLSTGLFKSSEQLKAAMVSLDKRFDKEIQRLERLLDSRRLNTTAKSNYEGMLSQVKNAKDLLGVDIYNQSKLSGLDIDSELNELDDLPF